MKKKYLLLALLLSGLSAAFATEAPQKLMVAPGTLSATSATLIWDKPVKYDDIVRYHIILNGKEAGTTAKGNYILNGLSPVKTYSCAVRSEDRDGKLSAPSAPVKFNTQHQGKTFNVTDFGAKGDGATINTKAIQKAIDACPVNGTVLIPEGTFMSGALYLKSHMTLQIAKGGVLKGSVSDVDYLPFINNRFEGWEMKTYASLINAGIMNNKGGYTVDDLHIKGEGTISGGNSPLAKNMMDHGGLRVRGRLICLLNCRDVEIQGLNIQDSPCWTIHYIYSKGVTCHDLKIVSTAHNGDGLDPDSSDDSYIFNCSFSTGDDCIAIKSGKNPEGFTIGKPTRNVRITDCDFIKGHGISIGSEMSGGVSDVLVQDCKAGALLNGMQIKGTKERGGYVKNVTVADCQLLKITIFTALNYNNDGAAAPEPPTFANFTFRNIDLSKASVAKGPVMDLNGFKDDAHKLKDCSFTNIITPDNARIVIKDAERLNFTNVKSASGAKPVYEANNSTNVVY
ncbi:glycoside hydrolase family 28 protein [Mucilaginibacter mali]|uniref:Glycoside hydrolase family 28 protein n=1 Tax=Mucilaginibacter mali TaxID=2740462 RepID=A0A7D4QCU0_9SPHI|nr:glycoside hydrolase family 28 protein [Mucilaginibacter mali]QKJ32565.1 glycoside hydrolase family 28 protein [Mucilaginibacter mali]